MSEVVLERDHQELANLLDNFEETVERKDYSGAFAALDMFWARLAMHIRAEHLCLFPAILAAAKHGGHELSPPIATIQSALTRLRADHNFFMQQLAKAIAMMRGLLAAPQKDAVVRMAEVREAVAAVKQRLEKHNRVEEEMVYRWPALLLSPAQLDQLRADIAREIENLPPRFAA